MIWDEDAMGIQAHPKIVRLALNKGHKGKKKLHPCIYIKKHHYTIDNVQMSDNTIK